MAFDGRRDRRLAIRHSAHVSPDEGELATRIAAVCFELLAQLFAPPSGHDFGALPGKHRGRRAPDPGCRAGDQRDFSLDHRSHNR
jgi:hypothetical protein